MKCKKRIAVALALSLSMGCVACSQPEINNETIKDLGKITTKQAAAATSVPKMTSAPNAARATDEQRQAELDNGKWKKKKNKIYYYDSNGNKVKGLVKINKKKYYFDSKGVQATGWWKINGNYYFFKNKNKASGYMVKNKTIDKIKLGKYGKAKLKKSWKKKKMKILIKCSKVIHKITNASMSVVQKMKKAYDWERKNYYIKGSPKYVYSSHPDVYYGYQMMSSGHAACYGWGAYYAYLANACGAKKCAFVSSGGHGWAEVNGRVSDPNWQFEDKGKSYFNFSYSESGHGRPNYKKNRKIVAWI
ncbi:MAG: hypothetical protein K5639_04630 [Eubacterium sp.]|nr:hypothetical protein [Eubacterium sp.]